MKRDSGQKNVPNKQLAHQLKARLFDKGFSYGTLPSVKRQSKNQNLQDKKTLVVALGRNSSSNLHQVIIKEQSTVFKRTVTKSHSKSKIQKYDFPPQQLKDRQEKTFQKINGPILGLSRAPSAQRLGVNRPTSRALSRDGSRGQLKESKSAFRLMSQTGTNFNRQQSSKSITYKAQIPNHQQLVNFAIDNNRPQTAMTMNKNMQMELRNTQNLMQKLSGRQLLEKKIQSRPISSFRKDINNLNNNVTPPMVTSNTSEKMIKFIPVKEQDIVIKRPIKQLDRYIQMILKNVAHVDEFVYLKKSLLYEEDPYDLQVIDYSHLKKEQKSGTIRDYFTISKKGLTFYLDNNPKEFQHLNDWLEERSSFDKIKSLNFFKQFRKWKTLKMWNKIIMKEKVFLISEQLKEKLFYLNENLRYVMLQVKQQVTNLEELKILSYSQNSYDSESTYDLEKFVKIQRKNRVKIKQIILECSKTCRDYVRDGFKKNIEVLKNQNKQTFNQFKPSSNDDGIKRKVPKTYAPSTKQAAYQKLQFPQNMDYEMRSKLRNECIRFLRFSYFIDFIALNSLKTIYDSSIEEFKHMINQKLISKNVYVMKEDLKEIRSTAQPIFEVQVQYHFYEVSGLKKHVLEPFMLPPSGTNTIQDYSILAYVNEKIPKEKKKTSKAGEEPESDYEQRTTFPVELPQSLCPQWISLNPTFQNHYIEIVNSFDEGLQTLRSFERWSKHEEMNIYRDILQEWDDKISEDILTEDFYLHPEEWIDSSINQTNKQQIKAIVEQSFLETTEFVQSIFEKFLLLYWQDLKINYKLFVSDKLADPIDCIQYSLQNLVEQKKMFLQQLPFIMDKQLLRVNSREIRLKIQDYPAQCLNKLYLMMPDYIRRINQDLILYLGESIKSLKNSTANVEDFVNQMKSLKKIDKKLPKIKDKIMFVGQIINVLQSLKPHVQGVEKDAPKAWKAIQTNLLQEMINLQNCISKVEEGADKNMIRFAEQVSKNLIPTLNKQISKMETLVEDKKFLSFNIAMNEAIEQLQVFDSTVKKFEQDSKKYAQYELVLNMPETKFQNLQDLRGNLNSRLDLWRGLRDWQLQSQKWMQEIFDQIDVEEIKQYSDKYSRIITKCTKKLPTNPVLDTFKKILTTFKDAMPVVIALSNKKLQEDAEYWKVIQTIVKTEFVIDKNFRLKDLIEKQFHVYQNEIIEISSLVKQEEILKTQIEENRNRWTKLEFNVKQYKPEDPRNKDAFVLDQIQDLYSELDELLANFSSILSNRYLKRQRNQAQELQKVIFNATLIIDDWLVVQKNWIYLQNIFGSSDIKSKLRQESAKFEQVDKSFKNHMRLTFRQKFVSKCLGNHETWIKYKDTLSEIQKELEKYLQDKRNDFPRFYFLSNDQLIEILAKANDLDAIQKNIRKCFECVGRINFQQNTRYIESVQSPEKQVFKINKTNINAKGEIQNWLKVLELSMDETLRKQIARGFIEYEQSKNRINFIKQRLSQVALLICQVNWTLDTEAFIDNLQDYYRLSLKQLTELTSQIRDPDLPDQTRRTLVALITQDVHNRDIVEELMEIEGLTKQDFSWSKQLRFYMEGDGFEAIAKAKQVDAQVQYGYEYLGIMSRLVITPLTDRCWMTIIGAINIKLGAAPAGPAGTGKTQSTKDLAKGLGMLCIVFNCSQQIEFKIMARLFAGLSQQGAWSCLDEFNRIDIEVLSVIAQQLLTIRVAKLRGDSVFFFNQRNINLKPGCGVFITMNPGYAGRTQLPDNLKVLFRPVSMMIPDYRLIAQIMLFAQGFEQAKLLSKKMVQLYKLSSEQLSQQDHYDFGMRAVKSVLVMAGALKRKSKNDSEEEVLIQAMRNANIPKFLKDDLPLFEALICDLFPSSEIKQVQYEQMQRQIQKVALQLKLQVVNSQTQKSIQLYETFNVRFGVMIVGSTNSGKTTCADLLAMSLTRMYKEQMQNKVPQPKFRNIKRHTLNPKSISMGELYGQINQLTQEWHDGLASSIMRQCTQEEDPFTNNWVVFDGPVDALWIQNMNTVLDDNMMLCLANGQRIKLTPSMRMLFEVMDLKVASPATVSRCGMVYMISEDLSWKSIVQSSLDAWCQKMKDIDQNDDYWTSDLKSYLMEIFERTLPSISTFIRKKTKQPIITSETHLGSSLFNIFSILCDPENGFKLKQERQYKKKFVTYAFAYSFIWSCCVTSFDRYHEDLSYQCRGLIESVIYPNNENVQSFYFDPNDVSFRHWNQKLPDFTYQKDQSFFEIIVETVDTCRYSFIIDILKSKSHPVLLTGPSGTGKSIQLLKIDISPLILTSTTSHSQLQSSVESKLDKIRKNLLGPGNGKINIIAIDDTNMPAEQQYGAIPPVQVLRSFVDKKGIWDRKERFWKTIQNVSFVCACSPPGGGRNELTPRFSRHFNVFCLPEPSHQSLMRIFKQILEGFFTVNQFVEIVKKQTESLVKATIEVYSIIKKQKLPIPSKFHYTFNLRDVSKIIQGVMEAKRTTCRDIETLGRLWFHECSRVLKDRLNTETDHHWFTEKLNEVMQVNFRTKKKEGAIYFSNINKLETRQYEEIPLLKKILPTIEEFQENHNSQNDTKLQLVLFTEAIEHILRIQRILTMSRGNGLLLGVAGSGKQSLTRLASYISGYQIKQIEITKGYNIDSFRTFIKALMRECSDKDKPTTFLFTDNQIIEEIFLEDINNILNSGQIPNLWQLEEKEDIINTTRPFNALLKRSQSPMIIYRTFVERVRERLHLILSMSPIGDSLRVRCRKYPALVNCCTMNWFFPWPEQALITVASAILQNFQNLPTYENLKRPQVVEIFADICKQVHISANLQAKKFQETLKRKVYTTPKSYLDMLKLYIILLDKKQKEVFEKRDRLTGGLQKLEQAGVQIKSLQKTLIKLKPQLESQNKKLAEALILVEKDSNQAAQIQAVVSVEAEEVMRQKNEIQALTDQAKQRLKEVEPDLQKARKAVESIDRKALQTIRGFQKPPQAVEIIMQGVCILFGIKADWQAQKKLLMRLDDFITSLKEYKKDSIPEDRLMKLRNHIQKPEFKEEVLFKKVREMLQIAQWCKAIEKYATVARQVEPKKRKMAEMQIQLDAANKQLDVKMKVLKAAQDKVQKLKNDTAQMMAKKNALEQELQLTKDRLTRASDLIVLTKDEAIRWKQTVQKMSSQVINLPLDVFVSAASISYNGPFTGIYRKNLMEYWKSVIGSKQLPISEDSSVSKILGDPLIIRDWIIDGLPSDTVSIENAIMSKQGNRWPFMIDPQNQSFKWLNKSYSQQAKKVVKITDANFLSTMKSAITNGLPVLLIDVEQTLPAVLDNIFAKEIKIIDNMPKVKFGDENIIYDKRFEIYIFTKLMNPNFLPQIFIRTNIINFTVTFNGLEEQLLAMVVKHEREQVEKQRDDNIVLMGQCNKKLNESELSILRLLKKAKAETILDDIELIQTLKNSQEASKDIKIKMQESKKLEKSITAIRQQYMPVATRGSILFFVIKDLSIIDNMYQYSLQYIQKIIHYSMDSAEKSKSVETRLNLLIDEITKNIYRNVSRGLFEKDKVLFSFLIATSINRHAKLINEEIWSVFSKGIPLSETGQAKPNPSKSLFSKKSWQLALYLESNYPKFIGLTSSLTGKLKEWESYGQASKLKNALPQDWEGKLETFDKLLIWRVLQPQKIALGISFYVANTIGQFYVEGIAVAVKDIYKDSDNRTPIIFVLSPGADPTANLLKFAGQISANVDIISLGQGQGDPAARLINKSKTSGRWVLLQNCHLAKTWMPSLQKIVEENFSPQVDIHQNFRLFLTSMPAPYFPSSILQNGIKLTTEPPRGIKANLKRSWNQISQEQLRLCPSKTEPYHKLLWGLTFFHALIQQRQKFGPLGWNIKYEFNESDLETSKTVLQMLLNKAQGYSNVPFESLLFVIGQINYGGRVTDDWDRRLLKTILGNFYRTQILSGSLQFSSCTEYVIPPFQSIENYRGYIDSLPLEDPTLLFGMHTNANITFYQQQEKQIMDTLLSLQPRESTGLGKSSQQIVLEIVTSILEKKEIPDPINLTHGHKDIFTRDDKNLLASLHTFLLQEIQRFNKLLKVIKKSLEQQQKAINGLVLMSDELDSMFYSLLINKVPENWKKCAYPSLKPLNSWIKDLSERVNFIRNWFNEGTVNSYWMSSFFFPQGFLTGVLQEYARHPDRQIAIDELVFSFKFTEMTKERCSIKAAEGVYIHGLYLEGACWDNSKKMLTEPVKNQLHYLMPIIQFVPVKNSDKKAPEKYEIYECPVYKTSVRAGVLSTTGQSTNFVLAVDVPTLEEGEKWILQGTALLLQLND